MKKRRGQAGKKRPHNALVRSKRRLPTVYLPESNEYLPEIYLPDPGAKHSGSRFKWLVSTCIAAVVGVTAIGMAMYASMDIEDDGGVLNTLQKAGIEGMKPVEQATIANAKLRVAGQKTDRLTVTSYGLSTQYTIHDRVAQKRGERDFIVLKPYSKVVATLSTARPVNTKSIPKFNPFKLYANTTPLSSSKRGTEGLDKKNITIKVVELTPNRLTNEDEQILAPDEIQQIVKEAGKFYDQEQLAKGSSNTLDIANNLSPKGEIEEKLPPQTTVIEKSNDDDDAIPEQREYHIVKIKRGDSLMNLIQQAGVSKSKANSVVKAMSTVFPANNVQAGQELRFILVPTENDEGKVEPLSMSLFAGPKHRVTIVKSGAGEYAEYIASESPVELTVGKGPKKSFAQRSSVYLSMYHAALAQKIPHQQVLKILRVHSYDVDFKRRVQSGDTFTAFFDENSKGKNSLYGELLYTSTTIGGQKKSFYRFRTPDGTVDFYDEKGSSSKKFLMRKPVRGARYTSGFGLRFHPILKKRKMHLGTDWAAPTGTPILAAGNGTVEFIGVKGGYGNFVHLRHANGYKTSYAHMHRFAKGMRKGLKVRQGQVIGYVGSTGRSSGPHLHYEVLVNSQRVNPMKIDVPRGRKLKGRLLGAFRNERERIDRLMRQPAVKTRVAKVEGQS
ncbi:MAG: peptidoglycan DD-metalloendopeptidase family protein [Methyloligellaceae bacterium]